MTIGSSAQRRGWCAARRALGLVPLAMLAAALAVAAPPPVSGVKPPSGTHPPGVTPTRPGSSGRKPVPPPRPADEIAADVRAFEERGAYGLAMESLKALRRRVQPDADLELALALDEARTGQVDSAAARLRGPLLSAALADTADARRRKDYDYDRFPVWSNAKFDGWYWYIARARAELALQQRRWSDAYAAALIACDARPYVGRERLLVAIAAGRAGDAERAARLAREAAELEPSLPEARYLNGVHLWRAGRRSDAAAEFRAAVALDSTYMPPAVALVRTRIPGAVADSLPDSFLHGVRAAGMLTTRERPKLEEFVQVDKISAIVTNAMPALPDSLKHLFDHPVDIYLAVMLDERGRAVLHELPWVRTGEFPPELATLISRSMPEWRFTPALRQGVAQRVWSTLRYTFKP